MPRPNPTRQVVKAAVHAAEARAEALTQNTPALNEAGASGSGHVDASTYVWHPAGISGVTSTADPFYSGG